MSTEIKGLDVVDSLVALGVTTAYWEYPGYVAIYLTEPGWYLATGQHGWDWVDWTNTDGIQRGPVAITHDNTVQGIADALADLYRLVTS